MLGNFVNCLPITLKYEGGYVDHPADPGGATNKGITLATFRQFRPDATKADLKRISQQEVEMIYRAGYWCPVRGDDLPAGVDLAVFDFAVNSGVSRASKYLQRVLGVPVDGKIGGVTVGAAVVRNRKEVIQHLCGARLSFVQGLGTFKVFGKGWSRRIADVEARAVAMALTSGGELTEAARAELRREAMNADDQSVKVASKSASATVAGGAAGTVDAAMNGGPDWLLLSLLAGFVLVAVAVYVLRAAQHKDRAEAYAALAG